MSMQMWAGLIGGDPRVVRKTREEAIKAAREWQTNNRDYIGPIHAVGVEVEI